MVLGPVPLINWTNFPSSIMQRQCRLQSKKCDGTSLHKGPYDTRPKEPSI
jgi:hypothetical protein